MQQAGTSASRKPAAGQAAVAAAATAIAAGAAADKASADVKAKPEPQAEERKVEQVSETRLKAAEFARNIWVMVAHATNEPKDLLKPEYWAHVSHKLKRHDHVEVWADNGTWYAELIVLDAGRGFGRVHMVRFEDLNAAPGGGQTITKGGYEIIWRGEHHKWSVVRLVDKEVVSEGHGTQGPAVDWLEERLKAER